MLGSSRFPTFSLILDTLFFDGLYPMRNARKRVPIGKLHTERLVPADAGVRQIMTRILALRLMVWPARLVKSHGFLLPRLGGHYALYQTLLRALAEAAKRAGCSCHVRPHRLRHTYASEMLRLGVSLPALMQLSATKIRHVRKRIRMTLR